MDDNGLELLLFPAPTSASQSDRRPSPDWIYVEKKLRCRSVTGLLLWEEYRAAKSNGFGYTWFCTTFEAWKQRAGPTMRQTHIGGEKVFFDFAGETIDIFDPVKRRGGDRINAVLVAAGFSFSLLLRWFERMLRALFLALCRVLIRPQHA